MADTTTLSVLLVLISPAVGSFLGVLIDRLPQGQSVVWSRSACQSCGTGLRPRDLIPLLSFLITRGRCRHCDAAIPRRLPGIELAATAAAMIAVFLGTTAGQMLGIAIVLWLLLALAGADLLWLRLPDILTGALLVCALGWTLLTGGDPGMALTGAALGAGSFLALRLGYAALRGREGLGLGDVKLMAGLGALTGPWDLPLMVLVAALTALAAAALSPGGLHGGRTLPFGAALCAAGAVVWLMGWGLK